MIYELLVAGAIALATLRRYSVAQTATLTSLAFFLSSGLTTVAAAPSYSLDTIAQPGMTNTMEPWRQPCGFSVLASIKRSPQNISVHRNLKWVRSQIKIAQNYFRAQLPDVDYLYSDVYIMMKERNTVSQMNWLPTGQLERYHKEVWCKEKAKKAEYALPVLHDALQRFAITFYSLQHFRLKSNNRNEATMDLRHKIFASMQNRVLTALCEVEEVINNLGLQLPRIHKSVIVTGNANWASEGDYTTMRIQDWGVVKRYRGFLNDWLRAFRNATATGPGTCDPNTIKPLNVGSKKKKPKKTLGPKGKKRLTKVRKPNRQIQKPITLSSEGAVPRGRRRGLRRRLIKNKRRKIL